jgi:hypothetical protein
LRSLLEARTFQPAFTEPANSFFAAILFQASTKARGIPDDMALAAMPGPIDRSHGDVIPDPRAE